MVFQDDTRFKRIWVVPYTLLAFWMVTWATSAITRTYAYGRRTAHTQLGDPATTPVNTTTKYDNGKHPHHWRAADSERVARTYFILSLAASLYVTVGYGQTRAQEALLWTFFVLATLHIIAAAAVRHIAIPIVFGIPAWILIMIILGLSFRT